MNLEITSFAELIAKDYFLSGELLGTVRLASTGRCMFDCEFKLTSTGWIWIDGHSVCGDGHVFNQ